VRKEKGRGKEREKEKKEVFGVKIRIKLHMSYATLFFQLYNFIFFLTVLKKLHFLES